MMSDEAFAKALPQVGLKATHPPATPQDDTWPGANAGGTEGPCDTTDISRTGQFTRLEQLLGTAALQRLAEAYVVVVGLGAVGSFAVEALARSGVGHLRLVDFDSVELSNINRQLIALHSTLAQPKVQLAAARVRDIFPACQVDSLALRVNPKNVLSILEPRPDLVVDAIDTVHDKVSLLCACLSHRVSVISSMGAARRSDPTRVRIGYLDEVQGCPLAKKIKNELKKVGSNGIQNTHRLRCVYSIEHPATLAPNDSDEKGSPRAMGSSICVTGVFGLVLASEVIKCLLAEKSIKTL